MPTLFIATRNAHKTREIEDLLGRSFTVTDLSGRTDWPQILEDGLTFADNARRKAIAISERHDQLVMADDSGLEVDALGGAPGVFSARYAGEEATDRQNIEKLLTELRQVAPREGDLKSARFRCSIALAHAGKIIHEVDGTVQGVIVDPARGSGGFGYDPIFQPTGYDKTFGELSAEVKNQISHRAAALNALRPFLATVRWEQPPESGIRPS